MSASGLSNAAETATSTAGFYSWNFGEAGNTFDVLNLTLGIHSEFRNNTMFRVAGVVPLSNDDFFDAEIQFSIIREF